MNIIKELKHWWYGSGTKCPKCGEWEFCDLLNDDYWECKICGYIEDRFYGIVTNRKDINEYWRRLRK